MLMSQSIGFIKKENLVSKDKPKKIPKYVVPIDLNEFVKRNFAGNLSAFCRYYECSYQQAMRWVEKKHVWYQGDVWRTVTKQPGKNKKK